MDHNLIYEVNLIELPFNYTCGYYPFRNCRLPWLMAFIIIRFLLCKC